MSKKVIIFLAAVLVILPSVMLAINVPPEPKGNFDITVDLTKTIDNIFTYVWEIFGAFAVAMFIWAGFLFLTASGDPSKVSTARKALLWGAIGVAVAMVASTIPFIVDNIIF